MNPKKYSKTFFITLAGLLIFLGLGFAFPTGTGQAVAQEAPNQAFVLTTDFQTGLFSIIDLATHQASNGVGSVHSDAVVRTFGGLVFVINRFGQDNIQVIDPSAGYATIAQYSTGNGSNPQDMAFVSMEKAYISRLGSPEVLIVNPMTGEQLGSVDFSNFNDADGLPEVYTMGIVGTSLYVALERLDENNFFAPTGPSFVIVVDTVTNAQMEVIPVEVNPITDLVKLPNGNLLLGSSGNFGVIGDGGINLIDTATNTNSVVISDEQLGGDLNQIVMITDTKGYALINDPSFNTSIVSFDVSTGTVGKTVVASEGFNIGGLAVNADKEVYVSWRVNDNPGVRIFNGLTDAEITTAPIDVGLPPTEIVFLE